MTKTQYLLTVFVALIFIGIGGPLACQRMQPKPAPVGMAAAGAVGATLTPFQPEVSTQLEVIDTLPPTRAEPTVTPKPTHTARPTEAPVYVQQVTQIVTVLHTRIPADTPTPQPTHTNTVSPLIVQLQHNQELQRRNDLWAQNLKEWFLSPFFITLVLIVGTFAGLWIYTLRWLERKTAPVTQTREEILDPMSAVEGVTDFEINRIRVLMALRTSRRQMEHDIYGHFGGAAHNKVSRAIEYIINNNTPPLVVSESVKQHYQSSSSV